MHVVTMSTKKSAATFKISDSQNWQNIKILSILAKSQFKAKVWLRANKKHHTYTTMAISHIKHLDIINNFKFQILQNWVNPKIPPFWRTWKIKRTTRSDHARSILGNHRQYSNHNAHINCNSIGTNSENQNVDLKIQKLTKNWGISKLEVGGRN